MMYMIRINQGKIGLVFRNGDYKRMLKPGLHFIGVMNTVRVYSLADRFVPHVELEILLKDEKLKTMLQVVEVADNEIAIRYRNGNFQEVLRPGQHVYFKGLIKHTFTKVDMNAIQFPAEVDNNLLAKPALLPYVRAFSVDPYEKGILMVDGMEKQILEPGAYFFVKNSTLIEILKADMRQLQLEVNGQEILTKDKAALRLNFSLQYSIRDIRKALLDNKDHAKQLYVFVQLALREFVGTQSLDELLGNKEAITEYVSAQVSSKAVELGLQIGTSGIKDVILPGEMKDIMNQVLVAQKQAEANTIMRREETASTRSLLNTAKLMEDNAMLFKLKEMEYVERIAEKVSDISLSGSNQVLDQLRDMFTGNKSP